MRQNVVECLLGLGECIREIALLEPLVCAKCLFEFQLLSADIVAELSLLGNVAIDGGVDPSQRLLRACVGFLSCGRGLEQILGLTLSEPLLTQALKVAVVLREQVAIAAIQRLDRVISLACVGRIGICLLYTSPSPRDLSTSRMPSSA